VTRPLTPRGPSLQPQARSFSRASQRSADQGSLSAHQGRPSEALSEAELAAMLDATESLLLDDTEREWGPHHQPGRLAPAPAQPSSLAGSRALVLSGAPGGGVTGRRRWYNARGARGNDADPEEHSFSGGREAAGWTGSGSEGSQEGEWGAGLGEEGQEPESAAQHDVRLYAETRAVMAEQQRLSGAHQRDQDQEGGGGGGEVGTAPPLLESDILQRCNFDLQQLNAYLSRRGRHEGDSALHVAAGEGSVEVTYWLLMEGAECCLGNAFGDTPLHLAARWGHCEVARLLLKGGAAHGATNSLGWTALHQAVSYGHGELAELLLEAGAGVAVGDSWGRCPVHFAASNGDAALLGALLSRGAAADSVTSEGDTPLHYAAGYGHADCCALLLRRGANCRRRKRGGVTALHFACAEGHPQVVQLLLEEGADANALDEQGLTPLHHAASCAQAPQVALLLLQSGADAHAACMEGSTPLDCVPYGAEELYQLMADGGLPSQDTQLALQQQEEEEEEEEEAYLAPQPELAWRGNDAVSGEQLQLTDGRQSVHSPSRIVALVDEEAEQQPNAQPYELQGEPLEEQALRRQMEQDLKALGFSDAEVSAYLGTLL